MAGELQLIYIGKLVRVHGYSKDDMKTEGLLNPGDYVLNTRRVRDQEHIRILMAKIDKAMAEGTPSHLSDEDQRVIDEDVLRRDAAVPPSPAPANVLRQDVAVPPSPAPANVLRPISSSDSDDDDIAVRSVNQESSDDFNLRPARSASEDDGDSVRRRVCADGMVREWLDSEDEDNMVLSDWLVWRRTGRIPEP